MRPVVSEAGAGHTGHTGDAENVGRRHGEAGQHGGQVVGISNAHLGAVMSGHAHPHVRRRHAGSTRPVSATMLLT